MWEVQVCLSAERIQIFVVIVIASPVVVVVVFFKRIGRVVVVVVIVVGERILGFVVIVLEWIRRHDRGLRWDEGLFDR